MNAVPERPRRVLKVVLGFECRNQCPYCAVVHSPAWPEARRLRLDPASAEARIAEVAERNEITALEIGAGESFLQPELLEWLVDLDERTLRAPIVLFASLEAPNVDRVFAALRRASAGAFVLVSYDGRFSERNAANWPTIEAEFRRLRAELAGSAVRLKVTACVTPENVARLEENFRSIAALDPAAPRFNWRPIKRTYAPDAAAAMVAGYERFLAWARGELPGAIEVPERGRVLRYELKPDWSCHGEGVSLLPDGRFTDCYVTYYCSDYPASRTVASLDGYDAVFEAMARPRLARCRRCLDAYSFCNQCEAGLADFRRATGEAFYDASFCALINRLAFASLRATFDLRPDAIVLLDRGPAGCLRLRASRDGVLVTDGDGGSWTIGRDGAGLDALLEL